MIVYLRAKLSPDGLLAKPTSLEIVTSRDDASELEPIESALLQASATLQWPQWDWRIERTLRERFVVFAVRDDDEAA